MTVDWLAATAPAALVGSIAELLDGVLGQSVVKPHGLKWYSSCMGWETGAVLAWDARRPECWLSINAESLRQLGPDGARNLAADLAALGVKPTRLDVAVDDASRQVLWLDLVHQAVAAGNVVGFKVVDFRRPQNPVSGELLGDSAMFGRRGKAGKGVYVRIYDKKLESGGLVDCIRLECELSGDVVQAAWSVLMSVSGDLAEWMAKLGQVAAACIDFRDRKHRTETHVDRMERLSWWQHVVELLGQVTIAVQKSVAPLQRTMDWFFRSWPRTIAKFCQVVEAQGDGLAMLVDAVRDAWAAAEDWRPGAKDLGIDLAALAAVLPSRHRPHAEPACGGDGH